jgi:hypothetical protein
MHPRDHNLFLHNLFMYIMNNITVTGGISENIYTLVSFSKDAVVLRRDLYNFSRHIYRT